MKKTLVLCLALAGCAEEPLGQQRFDLTTKDRSLFTAHGMSFKGVAGPYAVYRVTSSRPRLVGPSVTRGAGVAGLVAGSRYFGSGKNATVILRSGSHPLVGTTMAPADNGDCIPAQTPEDDPGGGGGGSSCDMSHNEVTVDVEDATVGAVLLIGRLSLSGRSNADVFGKICCDDDKCFPEEEPPLVK